MPDYTKLNNAIDAFEARSYGSDTDGELEADRARAMSAYMGENVLPVPEGRSAVVDRSVYETIQWIIPSLCRVFASGDDVIEIPPVGPEDEEAAKQESHYLNYILLQKNPWFEVFSTAAHDALLLKAGYLYAFKDKRRFVQTERYENQTPESLSILLNDKSLQVTDAEQIPSDEIDPMTGQPMVLFNVTVKRIKEDSAYKVVALAPDHCKVAEETPSWHLENCPYFEYWEEVTISDLRAEGFDVSDDIADGDDRDTQVDDKRNKYGEDQDIENSDPAMRVVRKRMIWVRHDYDQDGIAEMQYVVRVGNEILAREECNRIPVAVLACRPIPHRHIGASIADEQVDIQDIKTSILRQGLDNLYQTNNVRTYVNDELINVDDLMVNRPGGLIRGKGIFGQDIAPMPTPFMFDKAMAGLEYMDQVRENRSGVNRYFTGIDQNALNKTASGISQLTSMAAQRVEQIARTMALGVEQLASILHELILKHGHKKEVVRIRSKWVEVDPSSWKNRYDFRISVTYAAGNKDAQMGRLQVLANYQAQAMQSGVPIVTPQNLFETAMEITKAADISSPDRFWTQPEKIPPQGPPQPDPTVMAAESLKAQVTMQTKDMETQQRERDSVRDFEVKKYQIDTDATVKLTLAQAEREKALEVEGVKAANAMSMMERKDAGEEQRSKDRVKLLESLSDAERAITNLYQNSEQQAALLQIVTRLRKRISKRGKDGRAQEVESYDPESGAVVERMQVLRGADGRPEGLM